MKTKGGGGNMVNRVEPTLGVDVPTRGVALRDHFAAVVLSGLDAGFVSHVDHMSFEEIAEYCYKMADAMIKQRLK